MIPALSCGSLLGRLDGALYTFVRCMMFCIPLPFLWRCSSACRCKRPTCHMPHTYHFRVNAYHALGILRFFDSHENHKMRTLGVECTYTSDGLIVLHCLLLVVVLLSLLLAGYNFLNSCFPSCLLNTKIKCISRESNPGHIDGNDVFYH